MATDGTPDNYYCWTVTGEPNPETYPCFGGPMFIPITTTTVPEADFTVQQPVIVNQAAVFTNTTIGTLPISYTWQFGDGITSTVTHPTHVYTSTGSVVVELTAVNLLGSSTVTNTIQVLSPPLPIFLPHVQKPDS
jgi:PKD repeat protein